MNKRDIWRRSPEWVIENVGGELFERLARRELLANEWCKVEGRWASMTVAVGRIDHCRIVLLTTCVGGGLEVCNEFDAIRDLLADLLDDFRLFLPDIVVDVCINVPRMH